VSSPVFEDRMKEHGPGVTLSNPGLKAGKSRVDYNLRTP